MFDDSAVRSKVLAKVLAAALVSGIVSGLAGCAQETAEAPAPAAPNLDSDAAKASYFLAFSQIQGVKERFGEDLDDAAFRLGVEDALAGNEEKVTREAATASFTKINERIQERVEQVAVEMQAAGVAFLAENGQRDDVVTLDSGLQYEVLNGGEGDKPAATDTVVTHYHGTLIDGTVFDSSVERGEPATFPLNRVIKGWTEALQLMPVGAKWRLFLPPELAYGDRGAGEDIPPGSTLIFDVELLEIKE